MFLTQPSDVRDRLASADTIAVLGAHYEPQRPAFYVPDYLHRMGYRILPVNPKLKGALLFGETVVARLADLPAPCDMIEIFRAAPHLPGHLAEILALAPRPRTVWLQTGIVHRPFTEVLSQAGFDVVEDRCAFSDHRLFGLPKKSAAPAGSAR